MMDMRMYINSKGSTFVQYYRCFIPGKALQNKKASHHPNSTVTVKF